MFFFGVLKDFCDVVHLSFPVSAVFCGNLLEGLLSCLKGDLCGGRFLGRVNPRLRVLDPFVLEELLFVAPKAGGFDETRQNYGNDEGFIDNSLLE